ncbi:MAG: conjugative relaxase, partial [Geminicoccaceae bacterium]
MLSIGAVASAGAAGSYFGKDDYYASADHPPSAWLGDGADKLGLEGAVDRQTFQHVLEGYIPGEERRLGFEQAGEWKHRAGWDLTFSAPKSVSIMAQVAGDTRLIDAHDKAVAAAMAVAEKEVLATQAKREGAVISERTGSLVAASFRHDLSRNQDPQLHTHVVVVNMTLTDRGWRSVDSKPFYDAKMMLGQTYRQALAIEVRRLGYDVEAKQDGTFEIKGLDAGTQKVFSSRRAEIEAKLDAMGGRENASAADAAKATLATRRRKGIITRDDARAIWRGALTPAQNQTLDGLHAKAVSRARDGAARAVDSTRSDAATTVLREAVAILSERDAAFSKDRTLELANRIAVGRADRGDIANALDRAIRSGDLLGKQVVEADRSARADIAKEGLTTARQQRVERAMLEHEAKGRGAVARLANDRVATAIIAGAERIAEAHGHRWTDDQRAATHGLLTSRNRVHAVQGLAGTAKTTTVLATYAREAGRAGKDVRALAPTASAARTLGDALGKKAATVERLLTDVRFGKNPHQGNRFSRSEQVWIVDEASLLSSRQLRDLFKAAESEKARIVLVGDVRQLGSVEAGYGFGQLQQAGMPTERLEQIVRQTTDPLRRAVEQAAIGQAAASMDHFVRTPGALTVAKDPAERHETIARQYLVLTPTERATTIIVDPSRAGRDAITAQIRNGLIHEGALGRERLDATRLDAKGLTIAEKKQAMNYTAGDVVQFQRDLRFGGQTLPRGTPVTVIGVSQSDGTVTLAAAGGQPLNWSPKQKGARSAEVFTQKSTDLREGDRIVWTRNDRQQGLANGDTGRIAGLDAASRSATVAFDNGKTLQLTLDDH